MLSRFSSVHLGVKERLPLFFLPFFKQSPKADPDNVFLFRRLTEDMSKLMVLIDRWTIVNLLILILEVTGFVIALKTTGIPKLSMMTTNRSDSSKLDNRNI